MAFFALSKERTNARGKEYIYLRLGINWVIMLHVVAMDCSLMQAFIPQKWTGAVSLKKNKPTATWKE